LRDGGSPEGSDSKFFDWTILLCDGATEVEYSGRCYYLDGSGGVCDDGYVLAPQAALSTIANDFEGKTQKHQTQNNCCIDHLNEVSEGQDWGMPTHCLLPGPFPAGNPVLGGMGCTNTHIHETQQLTLCATGEQIELGGHVSTFNGPRGYKFYAPQDMRITDLFVPKDANEEVQHLQVILIRSLPNDFDTLFWQANIDADQWTTVDIDVDAGELIGILGVRGLDLVQTTYQDGPHTTQMFGTDVELSRIYSNVGDIKTAALTTVVPEVGKTGRIEMLIAPR
ncbi:MAG: hypothetical protein HN348_18975, partial [Proteobacteria bacterium]|nr:hypothetical protein [Pseudomonadota bacterium]